MLTEKLVPGVLFCREVLCLASKQKINYGKIRLFVTQIGNYVPILEIELFCVILVLLNRTGKELEMDNNFLYFDYLKPGTMFYEKMGREENQIEYSVGPLSEDWKIQVFDCWKLYTSSASKMPEQGWKIHISAALENAQEILKRVSRILLEKKISFKHVANEGFLQLMNSKTGNRSSSGKFIAIYPPDDEGFSTLLDELYESVKDIEKGPYILSDKCWKDSNVYFRYGGFQKMFTDTGVLAIKDKDGNLIPDNRTPYYRVPEFIEEPAIIQKENEKEKIVSRQPSKLSRYQISKALRFNNGGGIYLAKEKESGENVVIKEARPKVGLDGNNCDAVSRMHTEYTMLTKLSEVAGIVKVRDYFKVWENTFMVEEFAEGIDLTHWISAFYPFHEKQDLEAYIKKIKIIMDHMLTVVENMHRCGVGMGDLQPSNIIVDEKLNIKIIDFESAHDLQSEEKPAMFTIGFSHPDNKSYEERDWYGVKKVLKYCVLPIGPVDNLSSSIKAQHDHWILQTYGKDFADYVKEIEDKCDFHLKKTREQKVSSNINGGNAWDMDYLIEELRKGIITNHDNVPGLIRGDIRQYELENGRDCVLTGGFGAILALHRTGGLEEYSLRWVERFIEERPPIKDYGLFTGLSGIASVLYEIGYKEQATEMFDELLNSQKNTDITLRSGKAGIGLALAYFYKKNQNSIYLNAAIQIAEEIQQSVMAGEEIVVKDWAAVPAGLIDGWSGISLFFSCLYQLTGKSEYYDSAVQMLEKDLEHTQISEQEEVLQTKDERMRLLPYLSGGSAGIALAIWYLDQVSLKKHFEKEIKLILNLCSFRCTFSVGLFDGLGSLMLIPAISGDAEKKSQMLEKLSLYLVSQEKKGMLCPGNFSYRFSEDIFSGSSGIMLALEGMKQNNPFMWMPLIDINSKIAD